MASDYGRAQAACVIGGNSQPTPLESHRIRVGCETTALAVFERAKKESIDALRIRIEDLESVSYEDFVRMGSGK